MDLQEIILGAEVSKVLFSQADDLGLFALKTMPCKTTGFPRRGCIILLKWVIYKNW